MLSELVLCPLSNDALLKNQTSHLDHAAVRFEFEFPIVQRLRPLVRPRLKSGDKAKFL